MNRIEVKDLVGVRFVEGGRTPEQGFDCAGVVIWILENLTGSVCRIKPVKSTFDSPETQNQVLLNALAEECEEIRAPTPFAIVTFRSIDPLYSTHLGLVLEDGNDFIHCSRSAGGVVIDRLDSVRWKRRVTGFYRLKVDK